MKSVHRNLSLPPINNINNNAIKMFSPRRNKRSTINTTNSNKKSNSQNKKKRIQTSKTINHNDESTTSFIDDMKKGTYNILVCVRCRPLSFSEKQLSSNETIRIMDSKMVVLMDPIEYNGPKTIFKNRSKEQTYAFDFAFDKNCSQYTVFENSTKFLIDGVVNGYNATVFAYGATGAGKTYTMLGNENNPGIMPLTLRELFNKVNSFNDREYNLKFWYLEIYNENIRDLLKFMAKNKSNSNLDNTDNNINLTTNEYLDLREDPERGIVVNGITEININNSKDMLKILKRGNRNRTQEATGANETSSRSHAILQVSIEYKDKNSGIDIEIKYSKLSLIDLAGSERASATQNRGIRLIEGANINRSLLTLGNCINALCDANKGNKKVYIPYRDSKLTRLLKDSLGGNARTVMIANISPAINTFEDTYNTLKYANRAKNIKTFVTRNVLSAQYHISNYVNIINNLKAEVAQLKQQLQMKEGGNNNTFNKNNNFNTDNFHNNNNYYNYGNRNNNTNTYYQSDNQQQKKRINSPKLYSNSRYNENSFMSDDEFNEIVQNMKKACDGQVAVKQRIISIQNEMNKIKDTSNSKYNNLQQTLNINQNKYKEFSSTIEKIFNENSSKNKCTELQKDFLTLLMKNSSYKIQMLDNKYNNLLNLSKNDIQDEYIIELENQIQYRDEIIAENGYDINTNPNIKSLELLREQYAIKNLKTNTSGFRRVLPPVSGPASLNRDLSFVLNKGNNITNQINNNKYNNNANINSNINRGGMLFSSKKNSHLDNLKNKFNINNNNNLLLDYKTKNDYASYKILSNDNNKTKTNSPIRKNNNNNINSNHIYNQYKYNTNLNRNRVKSSVKNNNANDYLNYTGAHNSFILDNNNQSNNSTFDSGNAYLKDQVPQIKRSDLNNALSQRNRNRQKFLDNINSPNKK